MKKCLLFLIILLLQVAGYSQSLSFNKKLHNFGTILEADGVVSYTFIAKNISKTPFIINYISTGCGCTAAKYDKSPIMPNATREIIVDYNPENRAGIFRTAINIVGSVGGKSNTIHVIGNITAKEKTLKDLFPIVSGKIRMKEDIIPFGIIPGREKHSYFIELYNHSAKMVKIEVSNKGGENRRVWLTKTDVAPSQKSYLMYEIDLKDSGFLGDISDIITLTVDGVEQKQRIKISATIIPNVYDYTVEQLENAPVAIAYKTEHRIENIDKEGLSYTFEIENSAGGELKILKTIKKHKAVDCKVNFSALKRGEKGSITLTLDPTKFKGRANGTVTFITSSPHTPIFTLMLSAEHKQSGK